eukprot:SAG31_NODE_2136_length_6360_cov_5.316882_3_plen_51_part_00
MIASGDFDFVPASYVAEWPALVRFRVAMLNHSSICRSRLPEFWAQRQCQT